MSVRKKLVREARDVLRKRYNCLVISLDTIQGVPDAELEDEYLDYKGRIIDDTLEWVDLGEE